MKNNDEVNLEFVCCPLGCVSDDEVIFNEFAAGGGLSGKFSVVKCKGCGLMRTNPRPDSSSMSYYYPDNYAPYLSTLVPSNSNEVFKRIKTIAKFLLDPKSQAIPDMQPGRLLEIGCASGMFLHNMAQKGWDVKGVEFSRSSADYAIKLGYDVYCGALESAPEPSEPFDLFVGWMVLEHLHDPVACLTNMRRWAKPNSKLVLSIPNANSYEFSIFKQNWYALQLPNHLYHFTPETISKVLLESGWELERVIHQRTIKNIVSSLGLLLKSNGLERVGNKILSMPNWLMIPLFPLACVFAYFGQTGRMTIWANPLNLN